MIFFDKSLTHCVKFFKLKIFLYGKKRVLSLEIQNKIKSEFYQQSTVVQRTLKSEAKIN